MTKLTLYSKKRCHLCDVMKETILRIKDEYDFNFEIIDIETDNMLFEKYKEKIPVLMIDGRMFAKNRVDESKLRKKLS